MTKFDWEDIFYALTNESPYSFKEEAIVTLKLIKIDERGFRAITNSGFLGLISP